MNDFWTKFSSALDQLFQLNAVKLLILWICGAITFLSFGSLWVFSTFITWIAFFIYRKDCLITLSLGFIMMWFACSRRDSIIDKPLPQNSISAELQIRDITIVPERFSFKRRRYEAILSFEDKKYKVLAEFRSFPEGIAYGDSYIVSGQLVKANRAAFDGDFDYQIFLAERGVDAIFKVRDYSKETDRSSGFKIFSFTEKLRSLLLNRAVAGLPRSGIYTRFIIGVLLGNKDSVSVIEKQSLVNSGLFHIFAVSGLHVAIISIFLTGVLRLLFIKIRWRCFIMPILLLIYILVSGASPSAIRAWTMISIWSFARGIFRSVNLYNTLATTALILLLFSPLNLIDAGFQLSFVIVFFLVRAFAFKKHVYGVLTTLNLLIPSSKRGFGRTYYKFVFELLYLGMTVFLAALGLQLFYFGICQPLSIVTAAWSGLCAFGLLVSICLKCIFATSLINPLIIFFLDPLILFAEFVQNSRLFIQISRVSVELVLIYYSGLLIIASANRKAVKLGSVVIIVAALAMIFPFESTSWKIGVIKKKGQVCSVVSWNESTKIATVWLRKKYSQSPVIRLLKSKGVSQVVQLSRDNISVDNYNILDRFKVENQLVVDDTEWTQPLETLPAFKMMGNELMVKQFGQETRVDTSSFSDKTTIIDLP